MFSLLIRWVFITAGPTLLICSIVVAYHRRYPRFLRFAPLTTVFAYFVANAITFFYLGTAAFLEVPVAGFGLYIAVRLLWYPSVLTYLFAGCSFVFWLSELLYLYQAFVATYTLP